MTSTLRVLLGEHWPEPATAHWVVLDETGKVTNSGVGEPRSWPATARTEAILHGPQTSWLKVNVPKAGLREQALALGFALEEQLVREADSQHSTPTLQAADAWNVIVVARERMKRLVSQFQVISRPLDAVYSILQSLPCDDDVWAMGLDEYGIVVRRGGQLGWVEDRPANDDVPGVLEIAIAEARETAALPSRIILSGAASDLPVQRWAEHLGVAIEAGPRWAWYQNDGKMDDLLHDEFQPIHRRKAWQRALRPAAIAITILLGLHLLLGTAYVWWRRAEVNQIKHSMEQLMRSQLPNDPVLDPVAQIRRELNLQRGMHGQLADDAALSLMADLSTAMGAEINGTIQNLRYQDGALELGVQGNLDINRIRPSLEARGLSITQREGDGRFSVRRAN